ncbi:uncharacterized protein [Arachis hypogaea]|uniref:uncharacterized protein n=1 Tax=Arachis hypogaea TaxID=3818 RepID=UPI0034E7F7DC
MKRRRLIKKYQSPKKSFKDVENARLVSSPNVLKGEGLYNLKRKKMNILNRMLYMLKKMFIFQMMKMLSWHEKKDIFQVILGQHLLKARVNKSIYLKVHPFKMKFIVIAYQMLIFLIMKRYFLAKIEGLEQKSD